MKVLEPGKSTKVIPCQIRCSNCTALLLVDVEDCYTKKATSKHGSWKTAYFTCPECSHEQAPDEFQGVTDMMKSYQDFWMGAHKDES